MKKMLIFSLAYYPNVGGAEVAIKEITDRLAGIEFHVITLRFGDEPRYEKFGGVEVHRVGFGGSYISKIFFVPLAAFKAHSLHRKEKFDAAWAMMSYMLLPFVFSHIGLPYVLTLQEGDTENHMFGRLRVLPFLFILNFGFRHATVVQAISNHLGHWARKRGFRGQIEIIPNGVDIKKFSGELATHDVTVLITSSRLVHKNGIDTVIRALPLLPEIRFVICGTGPDEQTLRQLAKELGVEGRIHWRGHIDHFELPNHLHNADIFIRPSRSEGMGNSFVEAMAARLPVIATQEGGLKDFISPEVAWVVEKNRPDQIVLQIKDILSDPERAITVIKNARRMVEEKYDWGIIAQQMREKVFNRLFL